MTVRLLVDFKDPADGKQYVVGNLYTSAANEAGLIATKQATSDLTGGTAWVDPVVPESIDETKGVNVVLNASGNTMLVGADGMIPLNGALIGGIVVLYDGDSITDRGKVSGATLPLPLAANNSTGYNYGGYPTWERALLGSPFLADFQSVSGETIAQITTRLLATDFSPYAVVSMMCGTNFGARTVTIADVAGDMAQIMAVVDRAKTFGKPLRIFTVIPGSSWTAGEQAYVLALNTAIRKLPKTYPHVFVGDAFAALNDPAAAGVSVVAGYLDDGVHPSKLGAWRIAKYAGESSLRAALEYAGFSRILEAGRPFVDDAYTELLTNTDFKIQTGGTNSAGATLTVGTVPSAWRLLNTSCTDIKSYFPFYVPEAIRQRGMWASGMVFEVGDSVTNSGLAYICKTAHTDSGVFDATKFDRVWATDYCWQLTFTGDAADDGITIQRASSYSSLPSSVVRGVFGLAFEGEVGKIKKTTAVLEQWSDSSPGPSRGSFNYAMADILNLGEESTVDRVEGVFYTSRQAPWSEYTGALSTNNCPIVITLTAAGTASVILYAPSVRKY